MLSRSLTRCIKSSRRLKKPIQCFQSYKKNITSLSVHLEKLSNSISPINGLNKQNLLPLNLKRCYRSNGGSGGGGRGSNSFQYSSNYSNSKQNRSQKPHNSYTQVPNDKIKSFLKSQNMSFKTRGSGQITARECPMCPKPHNNKPDNLYTLNFKENEGAFLCFRCGSHGSWYDFVRYMLGDEMNFEKETHGHHHWGQGIAGRGNFSGGYNGGYGGGGNQDDKYERDFVKQYDLVNKTRAVISECQSAFDGLKEIERLIETGDEEDLELTTSSGDNTRIVTLAQSVYYLIGTDNSSQRHLSLDTLKEFRVGISEEVFRNEDGRMIRLPVIVFPFFRPFQGKKRKPEEITDLADSHYEAVKLKMRASDPEFKQFQRFKPSGGHFGVFGINTLKPDSKVCVITEGEFDAMAVYQATQLPSISLPNGASHLPVQLLPMIEKLERVYLWMDNDDIGQMNVENFCKKLGVHRTYVVKVGEEFADEVKDANDALRKDPEIIRKALMEARTLPSKNIVKTLNFFLFTFCSFPSYI